MSYISRQEIISDMLIDMEDLEKEYESDMERFCHGLSDSDIDFLLDSRDRAYDMQLELK